MLIFKKKLELKIIVYILISLSVKFLWYNLETNIELYESAIRIWIQWVKSKHSFLELTIWTFLQ